MPNRNNKRFKRNLMIAYAIIFLVAIFSKCNAQTDSCNYNYCYVFKDGDLKQQYNALEQAIIELNIPAIVDSCNPSLGVCLEFKDLDKWQVWKQIKRLTNYLMNGGLNGAFVPLSGTKNTAPLTGVIEHRLVDGTFAVDTTDNLVLGAGNSKDLVNTATVYSTITLSKTGKFVIEGTDGSTFDGGVSLGNGIFNVGFGNPSQVTQLSITNAGVANINSEFANFAGLQDASDPSAHYTNLSHVNRQYVTNNFAPISYTAAPTKATAPISITSGTISISLASGSTNGYLSSADWNTFNGKQTVLSGTGYVYQSGSTTSYTTSIPNGSLSNSTISGVSLGSNLFSHTVGYGISGSGFNGSASQAWTADTSVIGAKLFLTATYNKKLSGTGFVSQSGTTSSYIGSTGTNSVVLSTGATLITPTIGVAQGTSLLITPSANSCLQVGTGSTPNFPKDIYVRRDGSGLAPGLNITNANSAGITSIALEENGTNFAGVARYNSAYGASAFGSTNILQQASMSFQSGNLYQMPIVFGGMPIFLFTGNSASNAAVKLDATGVRIDACNAVGTTNNSNLFTVNGTSYFGGNTTANSTLQVSGSVSFSYISKTGSYTLTASDYTVENTSGANTFTLPTAVGITGREYVISNSSASALTLNTTSSQTIGGVTSKTLNVQYGGIRVQSNGANWTIVGIF